jgi:hypothetical protein
MHEFAPLEQVPCIPEGVEVGVLVAVLVGVFVAVWVGVLVAGTGVLVGVFVGVLVGVEVGVLVDVLVGVLVGVFVGVFVGVLVGVFVGVLVGVFVGVFVGVLVGVFVGVLVGVFVGVLVGVGVGVGWRQTPLTQISVAVQQSVPQGVVPLTQPHRCRPVRSLGRQMPEQQSPGLRQMSPPARQAAASPPDERRICAPGKPMPMAAAVAPNARLSNRLRD